MFNLLIKAGGWEEQEDSMYKDRLFGHTDENVAKEFRSDSGVDFYTLRNLPSVFMPEMQPHSSDDQLARVGSIVDVRTEGDTLHIRYAYDKSIPPIPNSLIMDEFASEWGISRWEPRRTHWAVKTADLYRSLLRFFAESPVRPSVFEIPSHPPINDDLVSVLAAPTQPAPTLATERFHSWVWDAARNLWTSKNYREAVGTAAASVEKQTQVKLDRGNLSGADLYTQAFKVDKIGDMPDGRRLRFPGLDELTEDGKRNQSWTSAHEGAMHFGRGCAQGIRNLSAHGTDDLPEQEALEHLAALSVLARWVDACQVVKSSSSETNSSTSDV